MSLDDFKLYNKQNNKNYPGDASSGFKPILPPSEIIYYKDFHFLDVPLVQRPPPPSKESEEVPKWEAVNGYTPKIVPPPPTTIVESVESKVAAAQEAIPVEKRSSPVKQQQFQ